MNHVIIDTSDEDARVVCDNFGDPQVFSTPDDAEAYRQMQCDPRLSYVLPRKLRRPSCWWMFWRR